MDIWSTECPYGYSSGVCLASSNPPRQHQACMCAALPPIPYPRQPFDRRDYKLQRKDQDSLLVLVCVNAELHADSYIVDLMKVGAWRGLSNKQISLLQIGFTMLTQHTCIGWKFDHPDILLQALSWLITPAMQPLSKQKVALPLVDLVGTGGHKASCTPSLKRL